MAPTAGPATKSFTERGHAAIRPTTTTATGKWATKYPKGLFAVKGLDAGTEIFRVERSLVAALSKERVGDSCGNCFGSEGEGVGEGVGVKEMKACTGCKQVWYCGKVS